MRLMNQYLLAYLGSAVVFLVTVQAAETWPG